MACPLLQLQGDLALAAEAPLRDVLRTDSPKLWLYNRLSFLLSVHLILRFFPLNEGQKKICFSAFCEPQYLSTCLQEHGGFKRGLYLEYANKQSVVQMLVLKGLLISL